MLVWVYRQVFVMLHIVMAFFAVLGTYLHITLIGSPKVCLLVPDIPHHPRHCCTHPWASVVVTTRLTLQFQMFKVMTEVAAAMWAFDRAVRLGVRIWLSFSATRHAALTMNSGSRLIQCATAEICTYGQDAEYSKLRISVPASKLRLHNKHSLLGGIAAGDDIRITIPRLQFVGEHPFTVFGVGTRSEDPAQGYIDLLIKTKAGLTRKLAHHVGKSSDVELANQQKKGSSVAVMVEGPFGVVPDIHEATDLVLVAGGIAITFCWPIFVSAFKARATSNLRSCKLIWIVRKQGE